MTLWNSRIETAWNLIIQSAKSCPWRLITRTFAVGKGFMNRRKEGWMNWLTIGCSWVPLCYVAMKTANDAPKCTWWELAAEMGRNQYQGKSYLTQKFIGVPVHLYSKDTLNYKKCRQSHLCTSRRGQMGYQWLHFCVCALYSPPSHQAFMHLQDLLLCIYVVFIKLIPSPKGYIFQSPEQVKKWIPLSTDV